MRGLITLSLIVLTLAGVCFAVPLFTTGEGRVLAVTTNTSQVTNLAANTVSVYVPSTSSETVFVLVNCDTNTFISRLASGVAIPIKGGAAYTFDTQAKTLITKLCYATTNGTATAHVAAY